MVRTNPNQAQLETNSNLEEDVQQLIEAYSRKSSDQPTAPKRAMSSYLESEAEIAKPWETFF
ncbi:hypothetical protein [Thioclava sp. GXIMD4215]|uniref:hypothetical protein n=1 Tax=Thioclava sp. GXIMD4215 TaxID=3131928 RepID=UPI003248FBFA